jgi:hypothetical protein
VVWTIGRDYFVKRRFKLLEAYDAQVFSAFAPRAAGRGSAASINGSSESHSVDVYSCRDGDDVPPSTPGSQVLVLY